VALAFFAVKGFDLAQILTAKFAKKSRQERKDTQIWAGLNQQ
jgi:hypothetical protein